MSLAVFGLGVGAGTSGASVVAGGGGGGGGSLTRGTVVWPPRRSTTSLGEGFPPVPNCQATTTSTVTATMPARATTPKFDSAGRGRGGRERGWETIGSRYGAKRGVNSGRG